MAQTNNTQLLRLLSYNIQVGIQTRHFADYIMANWQHLLPNQKRLENLHKISQLLKPYDIIALQEVDGGSLRSSYINQVEYLANYAGFPYWYHQCNRNLGKIAQHSNGLLSKIPVHKIINHKLPGLIPGRGAIEAIIGESDEKLIIIVAHLSLSKRARHKQVKFLAGVIANSPNVIIMGDLNCNSEQLLEQFSLHGIELKCTEDGNLDNSNTATFPSWQPSRQYDHILVSPSIEIVSQSVLPDPISDHLPVVLEVLLPASIISTETKVNHYHPVRISNELLHNQLRNHNP